MNGYPLYDIPKRLAKGFTDGLKISDMVYTGIQILFALVCAFALPAFGVPSIAAILVCLLIGGSAVGLLFPGSYKENLLTRIRRLRIYRARQGTFLYKRYSE